MITTLLAALYRMRMLTSLLKTSQAERLIGVVRTWYDRAPRTVQLTAAAATLAVLAWVLLS